LKAARNVIQDTELKVQIFATDFVGDAPVDIFVNAIRAQSFD
jgi:hypothetical protein